MGFWKVTYAAAIALGLASLKEKSEPLSYFSTVSGLEFSLCLARPALMTLPARRFVGRSARCLNACLSAVNIQDSAR